VNLELYKILSMNNSLSNHRHDMFRNGVYYIECRNPTLAKCEDETHTPKVGDLESSETPKNLELDCGGQNTSHWGVLDIIGKV
jgi:hypothetical protein